MCISRLLVILAVVLIGSGCDMTQTPTKEITGKPGTQEKAVTQTGGKPFIDLSTIHDTEGLRPFVGRQVMLTGNAILLGKNDLAGIALNSEGRSAVGLDQVPAWSEKDIGSKVQASGELFWYGSTDQRDVLEGVTLQLISGGYRLKKPSWRFVNR